MRRKSGQEKMWRKVCGEKVEKKCGENLDRRPGQEKSVKSGQETVDFLQTRIANNEKSRNRLGAELEEISMEYERVHAAAMITEKRGRNYEKVLGEWQAKAGDVAAEVEASQTEGRNYSSELFRLKAAQDEAVEHLDIVKRENKVYTSSNII